MINIGIFESCFVFFGVFMFDGGYFKYKVFGYMEDDFGMWMRVVGYCMMFVGKYFNVEYLGEVLLGWDD